MSSLFLKRYEPAEQGLLVEQVRQNTGYMNYYIIPPSPELSSFVRYFWIFEGEASCAQPYTHRTFASVCPELLFHYRGIFYEVAENGITLPSFRTGVHAQTSRYRRFRVSEPFGMFGIYFYPDALPALLGMPATELVDELPDLSDLIRKMDAGLEERMLAAADNNRRVDIISSFLVTKLQSPERPEIAHALRRIITLKGDINAREFASAYCLSQRQFERKFREQTGFTPKTFARIARFYAAVENPFRKTGSLTQLAYELGYYDQSHFIAEFREFAGISPREYFGKAHDSEYQD